jgi:hypothetical protein
VTCYPARFPVAAKTYRQMADECCDECRKLEGDGPWCCCCGREMPEADAYDEIWFTEDPCETCDE